MNIITILITLCRKYILSSEHRERRSRTLEDGNPIDVSRISRGILSPIGILLRQTHLRPFTSIHKLPLVLSRRIDVRSNHICVFLSKFLKLSLSLSLFRSLSYQLGSGQMCAESISTWLKRSTSASTSCELRKTRTRASRKCIRDTRIFFFPPLID